MAAISALASAPSGRRAPTWLVVALLALLLVAAAIWSITVGRYGVGVAKVWLNCRGVCVVPLHVLDSSPISG